MKIISSRDNPFVKQMIRLASSARERKTSGMTLLDGDHLIQAFAESAGSVEYLIATDSAGLSPEKNDLFRTVSCKEQVVVADAVFKSISDLAAPTGLMAVIRIPDAAPYPDEPESCLLLEGIQDPGNLGTILRTAVAAGFRHAFLSPQCAMAWSPKTLRAGMGAHFNMSVHEDANLADVAAMNGLTTVATDPRSSLSIYEADLRTAIGWILGAEGAGISQGLLERASMRLSVPMKGRLESLNVSSTAAICLFEQARQQGLSGSRATVPDRQ